MGLIIRNEIRSVKPVLDHPGLEHGASRHGTRARQHTTRPVDAPSLRR